MALDTETTTDKPSRMPAVLASSAELLSSASARASAALGLAWAALGRTAVGRFVSHSLLRRIMVSNLLGLIVLLLGAFYLNYTHPGLLDAKREFLEVQGKSIAAAIGDNSRYDTGTGGLEPTRAIDLDTSRVPYRDDGFAALELSLSPERVTPILNRIIQPTNLRARIYDRAGNLVVDTATLLKKGPGHVARPEPLADPARPRTRSLYTKITQFLLDGDLPVYREIGNANGTAYPEVQEALRGKSTAVLLIDNSSEQIVAVAEPIRRGKSRTVQGVLLLSTRPGDISKVVAEQRSLIWALATFAFLATLTSSWLLARTVADPMKRLSDAAEHVTKHISASKELPDYTARNDEVGQMSTAFRSMTGALVKRIEASEKFAADVAHELKNPLAAARSTAEALTYAKTDEHRAQLVGQIQGELKRLNRLISDVSNASRLDAELARQKMTPLDVRAVVSNVAGIFSELLANDTRRVILSNDTGAEADFRVSAHEGRLAQVMTNLIDNAISFSPANTMVTVATRRNGAWVEVTVSDQGPGIPTDSLDTIFERFYSDRPDTDQKRGKNSGLGLSISREIVEAHNGRIWAENIKAANEDKPTGARFIVQLPSAALQPRSSLTTSWRK
jgi:two-component system, OmpR family, sensor histidine kinase ChvG